MLQGDGRARGLNQVQAPGVLEKYRMYVCLHMYRVACGWGSVFYCVRELCFIVLGKMYVWVRKKRVCVYENNVLPYVIFVRF